jgi:hypothetical protein
VYGPVSSQRVGECLVIAGRVLPLGALSPGLLSIWQRPLVLPSVTETRDLRGLSRSASSKPPGIRHLVESRHHSLEPRVPAAELATRSEYVYGNESTISRFDMTHVLPEICTSRYEPPELVPRYDDSSMAIDDAYPFWAKLDLRTRRNKGHRSQC